MSIVDPDDTSDPIIVGAPIDGATVHIVDDNGHILPTGETGELVVGGDCISPGYIDAKGESAPSFSDKRWHTDLNMYRTGDRAIQLADSRLIILGRVDNQLKIRGFRVEPEMIEAVLMTHACVRFAAVTHEVVAGGNRLRGFLCIDGQTPSLTSIMTHLQDRLPLHMVPATFTVIPKPPMLPSGKCDRGALASIAGTALIHTEPNATQESDPTSAGRDETEIDSQVAAIWFDVLGQHANRTDNFFEIGGDSLSASRAIDRINKQIGANISIRDFFDQPTIAQLAALIQQKLTSA